MSTWLSQIESSWDCPNFVVVRHMKYRPYSFLNPIPLSGNSATLRYFGQNTVNCSSNGNRAVEIP